jgi:hypothetical protein
MRGAEASRKRARQSTRRKTGEKDIKVFAYVGKRGGIKWTRVR